MEQRTCVMGDSVGEMVGDSCLLRPRRCSLPGDRVSGLMGAGRRRGELLDMRSDELMEGLLSEDCSWQLLSEAWMEGLLREEDRPAGQRIWLQMLQLCTATLSSWKPQTTCGSRDRR